jgi:hypothetical protein
LPIPLKRTYPEFAQTYIFSFLEECIARCAGTGALTADILDESINELLAILATRTHDIVCARHVSHPRSMPRARNRA